MSTNFQVFDSTKANMMGDSDYTSSTWRTEGNKAGIAPADVYNKLFYQASIFPAAFAAALSAAGYTVSDSSLSTLTTLLGAQVITYGSNYIKFGSGLMIQTKATGSWTTGSSIAECSVTWDVSFYDSAYLATALCEVADTPMINSIKSSAKSASSCTLFLQRADEATATSSPSMLIQVLAFGRWKA